MVALWNRETIYIFIIIYYTLGIKDPEGFGKNNVSNCRSDHYSGQSSRTNESWSRMLLCRCNKTEMRWNEKAVSRLSPERWLILCVKTVRKLEMWANAQHDGRPAEHRWRLLFNATKFGWRSLLDCRAVTMPRRETSWNLQVCPKLLNRSQPLVGRSSPYCGDI